MIPYNIFELINNFLVYMFKNKSKHIPVEIISYIGTFMNTQGLIKILITNKTNFNYNIQRFKLLQKREFILNNFCTEIIDLISLKVLLTTSIKEWNPKFLGSTGYIDGITLSDINYPITIGIDNNYRPFIVLRHTIPKYKSYPSKYCLDILFQRYSACKNTWSNAVVGYRSFICEGGHFMTNGNINHEYFKKNINNLINNKEYIIIPKYNPDMSTVENRFTLLLV